MKVTLIDQGPKLTEQDIAKFEQRLGVSLPLEYRDFLLLNNGGYLRPEGIFKIYSLLKIHINTSVMTSFLSIKSGDENSFDTYLMILSGRVPPAYFPIGHDGFGNVICIEHKGHNKGKLFWWNHEEEEMNPKKKATYRNIYFLANSFNEFISSLEEYKY